MTWTTEHLYQLLPAIYRLRDEEHGQPLRALIAVIAEQAAVVEEDISRLYDNWFIETCDEWVAPYIGDLLGVRGLHQVTEATFSQRARVANTLGYRRRKGTASMLEQLARDTTGWPSRVVECFRLLATTQHVNDVRLTNVRTPDLRNSGVLSLLNTPFDTIGHAVDVRHIDRTRGVHNIMNVAMFFWRLQAYPVEQAPAFRHGAGRYSFSQLGHDVPLFTHPSTETDPSHLAEEINVPAPIRRLALKASLESSEERYYGNDLSFRLWVGDDEVPREKIVACNLSHWQHRPRKNHVAVDPELGRIAFPAGHEPGAVRVDYHYGASSDVGGGCYERALSASGFAQYPIGKSVGIPSIEQAIDRWTAEGSPNAVLEIQDNAVYEEALHLVVPPEKSLEIRAANRRRPVVRLADPFTIAGAPVSAADQQGGRLIIDGLLITGQRIDVPNGDLASLELKHCTLVPGLGLTADGVPATAGDPSLLVSGRNGRLVIDVTRSICGGLQVPGIETLTVADSVIDGTGGPAIQTETLVVRESTVIGSVTATLIELASNSIFTGQVTSERKQAGCIRFCYLPPGSQVPRRYRCQPDVAARNARQATLAAAGRTRRGAQANGLQPSFTTVRYGQPGYAQLDARCPVEITSGADDQSEMGVYHHLKQPQREANFRASLDEYLRLGLEAGIFYVT